MDFNIQFRNHQQRELFHDGTRNECICGGFGSGKTYVACMKLMLLLLAFNKYRVVVARQIYKDLLNTTYKTFMKMLDPSIVMRWDEQKGYMKLINGSEIMWMHLDDVDEGTLKGLEINSVYVDQPEEISESIYTILDARIGRWDKAYPNPKFSSHLEYKKDEFGNWIVPNYMLLSPNPDSEDHWIWRYYHPDSPERRINHSYYEVSSTENPSLNKETLQIMLSRDPAWVSRFVYGKWGISDILIHRVLPSSIIDPPQELLRTILNKSNIYRTLDHGDASPTCCLWGASYFQPDTKRTLHIMFQEYYRANGNISEHRQAIHDLSEGLYISGSYADPEIFKSKHQKYSQQWTVAQDYTDSNYDAPAIAWSPADNNEMATRNRINEGLSLNEFVKHPITNESPAPHIYFVRRNIANHSFGVENLLTEIKTQKRIKIGEINGKPIYSDDRIKDIPDHAYDPFRYYIASRSKGPAIKQREIGTNSFLGNRNRMKMLWAIKAYNAKGDRRALA